MEIMETLINAVVGMAVVFAVLVLLMGMIAIMSKIVKSGKSKKTEVAAPAANAQTSTIGTKPEAARGSCGDVKLFDVPDKTAAQLMAITADKLGVPLNTLRFISIKEVK